MAHVALHLSHAARAASRAIAAEDMFHASLLHLRPGTTVRTLAPSAPRALALMHGPAFTGDTVAALNALADDLDARVLAAMKLAAPG